VILGLHKSCLTDENLLRGCYGHLCK